MDLYKQVFSREKCLKSLTGFVLILFIVGALWSVAWGEGPAFSDPNEKLTYPIIDTFLTKCYDNNNNVIPCPEPGEPFYGQDAQYDGIQPAYKDNGDGTITDLNTGLMWQKTTDARPDTLEGRYTWYEGEEYAKNLKLGGYSDWRIPSVKELISLVDARGGLAERGERKPYFDETYFDFSYGPEGIDGYRRIEVQLVTTTSYISKSVLFSDWWTNFGEKEIEPGKMYVAPTFFSYNFSDGRIKSYPKTNHPYLGTPTWVIRCVRGPKYGENKLVGNRDGTISDLATGLMWQKSDDGKGRNWEEALKYAEDMTLAGYGDWRLPNQKELHSIVDYGFIPAIHPIFHIEDPKGWFWTSTSIGRGQADYIAFGKGTGRIGSRPEDEYDVHGAGSMRSDPMEGDPSCYLEGGWPQKDTKRIYNYVRLVRNNVKPERRPRH